MDFPTAEDLSLDLSAFPGLLELWMRLNGVSLGLVLGDVGFMMPPGI